MERQSMEFKMREGISLALYNSLRSNWETVENTELCARGGRRGMMCWKLEIWRQKVVRRKNNNDLCSECRKEEKNSHMLRCEGTKICRDVFLEKYCRNIYIEIGIRRTVGCKHKEQWQKIGIYMIKYEDK